MHSETTAPAMMNSGTAQGWFSPTTDQHQDSRKEVLADPCRK